MKRQGRGWVAASLLPCLAISVVLVVGSGLGSLAGAASANGPGPLVRLAGAAPLLPAGSAVVGPADASAEVTVDVALHPRDQSALDAFVAAVSTPGSPQYHHYLAARSVRPDVRADPGDHRCHPLVADLVGPPARADVGRRSPDSGHRLHGPTGTGPRRVPGVRPPFRRSGGPVHSATGRRPLVAGVVGGRGDRTVDGGHTATATGHHTSGWLVGPGWDPDGPGP